MAACTMSRGLDGWKTMLNIIIVGYPQLIWGIIFQDNIVAKDLTE